LERKLEPSAARGDAAGGKLAALHYTWVGYVLCLAKMLPVWRFAADISIDEKYLNIRSLLYDEKYFLNIFSKILYKSKTTSTILW
jgi:hypothetical protein